MTLSLRTGTEADAAVTGTICFHAFKAIADAHNFPQDFPHVEAAIGFYTWLLKHPAFFSTVAELDGRIIGSNFLDERNPIAGVGPVTVDPSTQNSGIGAALMQSVLARADERGFAGVRLVQAGYHRRSLALYLRLGFDVREHLSCLQGPAIGKVPAGCEVRPASAEDAPVCNALCFRVHGHDRAGELADAIAQGAARVVERNGRISGYATPVAFFGHAVGETDEDLMALIGAAEAFPGPGVLVPSSNGELVRWCLSEGLRITQSFTLMSIGLYAEPRGAWLPSVMF